jgi:hypothetical protein
VLQNLQFFRPNFKLTYIILGGIMGNRFYKFIAGLFFIFFSNSAFAYVTYPDGSGGIDKWGSSNTPGTPGGNVTWGFIPAGTPGSAYCGTACPGNSVDSINIENSPGTGYTLTAFTSLSSYITSALNKWASVANISFSGPFTDSGLPINDQGAASPNIRIGVFAFSSGGGAVGFAPPPNGGTGSGDIIFDSNSFYAFQPGNNGDAFPSASTAPNDFESLLLHEIGHALGLNHPVFDGTCPVMQVDSACLNKINRNLGADDIAGIQHIYGAPVPLPAAVWSFGAGLFGFLWLSRKRSLL